LIVCGIKPEGAMNCQASDFLRKNNQELSGRIVELQYALQPEVWLPYGESGRQTSIRDGLYHLNYLAEAVQADDPALFSEYVAWLKTLFTGLGFPESALPLMLECTRQALMERLPEAIQPQVLEVLKAGICGLHPVSSPPQDGLNGDEPVQQLSGKFIESLLRSDRNSAAKLILDAVEKRGFSVKEIYLNVFQVSQREIGRLWQTGQISVAQEHYCTASTQMIMSLLYPYLFTGKIKERRMVMACVSGELHELGARMVADFFEMDGWDTYFVGANTPYDSIVRFVIDHKAHLLALSATMTFNIGPIREIIKKLRVSPASRTPVLVGGYPFNLSSGLWRNVGADGFARDAQSALEEAERLLA
jgi:MerR family transcriptional regulator, light-induced transcriptional regulator